MPNVKTLKLLIGLCLLHSCVVTAAENGGAQTWELGPFVRPNNVNPVIKPDTNLLFDCPMNNHPIQWAALNTFNPGAVLKGDQVCVLFRSEDSSGSMIIGGHTSRIGLAESSDGEHFVCRPAPVLFPAEDNEKANEWTGGCEDPRVVEADNGMYVVTYTEYRRESTGRLARLGVATSPDLIHWDKHGPAFEKLGGDFANHYCKSGAIVTRLVNGRLIAVKYHGKYWMYWGEGEIHLASSDNLTDWSPGPVVLRTRPQKFDSALVEAGPPAVITDQGILLIYNGKNASRNGDTSLNAGAYSGGQVLFDLADPTKVLQRTDSPFFKPEAAFERTGQYKAGTTFLEGLVYFHGEWLLYYGCADSYVGMAAAKN
jgi:beta-1,2-mannosidase